MTSRLRCIFPFLLFSPLCAFAQVAGPAQKSVQAVRVDTAPIMDGVLDDAVWQQAIPITDFHQIRPGDGTPPSEATEVYIVYTEDALYIGARMGDSNPELIASPTIRHGQGLGPDDRLIVIIDPFNTRRTGYRFETNLNGVRHEALYTTVSSFQGDWVTIWDTQTSRDENGWNAEIEIPFKSLPFDPTTTEWGFNFGRGIRRRGEEMAWVSFNRNFNASILGTMTGMRDINQGVGLDIVPSFSVTSQKRHALNVTDYNEQPSLDAFYRLTPSMNAALTINTDFSATEVDNRQVNLTRFNLFFPEKRDFFLNDSDLFQFGNISNTGNGAMSAASRENARPYFSRKIGLGPGGVPVDVEYGGRISGRLGRFNLGTLAIRQGEFGAVDAQSLFVARASANVLSESNVGFIVTDGDPTSNRDNTVAGVDFRYLNTRLASGRQIEGDAWYQQSDTPGLEGDDAAFGLGLRTPNNTGWRAGAGYKEVQRNFNPAMGFVQRTNIEDYFADAGYTRFFSGGLLQSVYTGVDAERIEQIGGGLQSQTLRLNLLDVSTNTRDGGWLQFQRSREVVDAPFTLYSEPGRVVAMQPGDYEFDEATIGINTANQRRYSGGLRLTTGEFYDGDRNNVGVNFQWNHSRFFLLNLNYDWNDIKLPQGDFTTRLVSVNAQVAFSSQLFWVSLLQYDNVSEELGLNTRLQWIPKAGQEGFIVLNYNLEDKDKDNTFKSQAMDVSIKFKYTLRY
ncbi:MAG TPA: DUF5916 domain-containing protein [Pseudomonadales bacterium]